MLSKIIKKNEFNPGLLGLFVNPFYFSRLNLHINISSLAHYITGKILDVGCGKKPYQNLFQSSQYIGLEYDTPDNRKSKNADFFYDGKIFPFSNAEFDSIICNEVLEHVFNPKEFLSEMNRVLKSGGLLLMTVPFVWDEHEQPYDYARYSSFGLKHLIEENGFKIIEQRKSADDISVIFQLINVFIYKKILGKAVRPKRIKRIMIRSLCSIFNIMGFVLIKILPKNQDLYLDNIIIAKKSDA